MNLATGTYRITGLFARWAEYELWLVDTRPCRIKGVAVIEKPERDPCNYDMERKYQVTFISIYLYIASNMYNVREIRTWYELNMKRVFQSAILNLTWFAGERQRAVIELKTACK